MKEDILKFRKCCEILKSEKGFTNEKLCKELGISDPTLSKLMTFDLSDLKGIRASTLGIIQGFLKRHCNDVNYAGIKSAPDNIVEKASEKISEVGNLRKNLSNYQTSGEPPKKIEVTAEDKEKIETVNPFPLLFEAMKLVPPHIKITITIN